MKKLDLVGYFLLGSAAVVGGLLLGAVATSAIAAVDSPQEVEIKTAFWITDPDTGAVKACTVDWDRASSVQGLMVPMLCVDVVNPQECVGDNTTGRIACSAEDKAPSRVRTDK